MSRISKLPRKTYELTEKDFLRMMSGYLNYRKGEKVAPKFWFPREDYVLILDVKVKR